MSVVLIPINLFFFLFPPRTKLEFYFIPETRNEGRLTGLVNDERISLLNSGPPTANIKLHVQQFKW